MMMQRGNVIKISLISIYLIFIAGSIAMGFGPGKDIGFIFSDFAMDMLKILPSAFILIGLFEVWVKKETVEKHLGEMSGFRGYIYSMLLAGTMVGGLYVSFPVACSLYTKGAKLSIIFTFIGASAICRIPMTIFESSFMGVKFTAIRFLVSLPLIVLTSILLGNYLAKRDYKMLNRL